MVVQDHELIATTGRGDRKTSGLVSAQFFYKLDYLYLRHLGLGTSFLLRKGKGRHSRRIGDGVVGEVVLVDHTFCRSWRR